MTAATIRAASCQPFVKWAGGKRRLLTRLHDLMPPTWNRYVEPFLGGGAMFFSLVPRVAVIGDVNDDLMSCYRVVRDEPEALIAALDGFENTQSFFDSVRAQRSRDLDDVAAAARFIYLNRTCFNGLYRVNRHGQFNVPFGRYANPLLVPAEQIRAASAALQGADLRCADYASIVAEAGRGDFVYLDPPYIAASRYSDFRRYHREQFRDDDHATLARTVDALDRRGALVMLSNSDTPLVRELFGHLELHAVSTTRSISAKTSGRGAIGELVVTNY